MRSWRTASVITLAAFLLWLPSVTLQQEYSTCPEDDEECLAYEASLNLFGSSWQMNPILDLGESDVKVFPVEIDTGSTVDMFVHRPMGQVQYTRNILGTGTAFNALNVTESYVYTFAAGDLNNDGHVDVATIDLDNQACWVHFNPLLSGGSSVWRVSPFWESKKVFSLDELFTVSSITYRLDSLLIDDINEDGKNDILVTLDEITADKTNGSVETVSTLYVLYQTEEGEFQTDVVNFTKQAIYPILVRNFDVDDKSLKDVLYLENGKLHIGYNQDPHWSTELVYDDATFDRNSDRLNIECSDVNRDGYEDILLPYNDNGEFGYLLNPAGLRDGWKWVTIEALDSDELVEDYVVVDIDQDGSTDFFTIHAGSLKWYHQYKERTGIEEYYNHFTIFPINITPEEDRHSWNRMMTMPHTAGFSTKLIVMDKSTSRVDWIRKRELALTGFGWNPNFWLYLMIYTIAVSLSVATIHAYCLKKLENDSIGEKLIDKLGGPGQWDMNNIEAVRKEIMKNQRNRTTSV